MDVILQILIITCVMNQVTLTSSVAALSALPALATLQPSLAGLILAAAVACWLTTSALIPKVAEFMLKKRIFGYDINKKGRKEGEKEVPECVGFSAAVAFSMVGMAVTLLLKCWASPQSLTTHIAVFVTIFGTILLGFADDMLELPWRYKLIFPLFIVLPLVCVYAGPTQVGVIAPFSWVLGPSLELGCLYLAYITLLGIYFTNAINIYAGINGLEVGQSIIAASGMLAYFAASSHLGAPHPDYTYSVYLLATFLAASLALMRLNAYPASIFIGDTYCYFAGIVLAIAAIWGSIPIVCQWFLFPQLLNFLYSTPQLFGLYPCPRHRLPRYDLPNDRLVAIPTNMNLVNLALRLLGPTSEKDLCLKLLCFQVLCCCVPTIYLLATGNTHQL